MELFGNGAKHRVGLDEPCLRGEECVRVLDLRIGRILSDNRGRGREVDVHRSRGLVDRLQTRRDDASDENANCHKGGDLPKVPAEDPQVVRNGNRWRFSFDLLLRGHLRIVGHLLWRGVRKRIAIPPLKRALSYDQRYGRENLQQKAEAAMERLYSRSLRHRGSGGL